MDKEFRVWLWGEGGGGGGILHMLLNNGADKMFAVANIR